MTTNEKEISLIKDFNLIQIKSSESEKIKAKITELEHNAQIFKKKVLGSDGSTERENGL